KQGVALSPDLPSAGKDSWALSDDLIMSAIGNRSGSRGCKFGPSLGVMLTADDLESLSAGFDSWVQSRSKALGLREYKDCVTLEGSKVRRVLDTTPNLRGEVVRVLFETHDHFRNFLLLAAETSVFSPPADCAPWEG
ncbi:MAG: hypothetical protein ACU0CI_09100, partial [Shimia sp.]